MGGLAQYQYLDKRGLLGFPVKGVPAGFPSQTERVWGFVEKKFREEVSIDPYALGLTSVVRRISLPQSHAQVNSLATNFEQLAAQWKRETKFLSSITDKVMHPSYQRIIGLGPDVLPLILENLRREGGHWYWALQSITGENPVLPEHRGDTSKMKNDWIAWGVSRGYLR